MRYPDRGITSITCGKRAKRVPPPVPATHIYTLPRMGLYAVSNVSHIAIRSYIATHSHLSMRASDTMYYPLRGSFLLALFVHGWRSPYGFAYPRLPKYYPYRGSAPYGSIASYRGSRDITSAQHTKSQIDFALNSQYSTLQRYCHHTGVAMTSGTYIKSIGRHFCATR